MPEVVAGEGLIFPQLSIDRGEVPVADLYRSVCLGDLFGDVGDRYSIRFFTRSSVRERETGVRSGNSQGFRQPFASYRVCAGGHDGGGCFFARGFELAISGWESRSTIRFIFWQGSRTSFHRDAILNKPSQTRLGDLGKRSC